MWPVIKIKVCTLLSSLAQFCATCELHREKRHCHRGRQWTKWYGSACAQSACMHTKPPHLNVNRYHAHCLQHGEYTASHSLKIRKVWLRIFRGTFHFAIPWLDSLTAKLSITLTKRHYKHWFSSPFKVYYKCVSFAAKAKLHHTFITVIF